MRRRRIYVSLLGFLPYDRADIYNRKGRITMFTKLSLTIAIMILSISMSSCNTKSPSSSSDTNSPTGTNSTEGNENYQMLPLITGKVADVSLDAMADGTTQQLKKGEVMSITLESNPSTGYSWFTTISNPAILVQMGEPQYQEPTSSTPVLGATGTDTFYFQAADTGTTTLIMNYTRGFESSVAPEKTITITVEVK
jgi:inhibitor of cysteine peptidase